MTGGDFAGSGECGEGCGWCAIGQLQITRDVVDRFQIRDGGSFRSGFEIFKFPGGREDAGFEGADGVVVILDGVAQRTAEFGEMLGKFSEALMEGAAKLGNFAGIFGDRFLTPAEGDGP